jgi:hypothetical protein
MIAANRNELAEGQERLAMDIHSRLSVEEHAELESLMEVRNLNGPIAASITRLHGFLTSVISELVSNSGEIPRTLSWG